MIAYLDVSSILSDEMLLGCVVDCGYAVAEVERTVRALKLPAAARWAVVAEPAQRGALRTMRVDLLADEEGGAHSLSDARRWVEEADLPPPLRERIAACLNRLPHREAGGRESSLIETVATLAAVLAGFDALGIERLYGTRTAPTTPPAAAAAAAATILAELATFEQPEMILARVGVGAGDVPGDDPRPRLARLWLGEPLAALYDAGCWRTT